MLNVPISAIECYYVFSPCPGKHEGMVVGSSSSLASYYNSPLLQSVQLRNQADLLSCRLHAPRQVTYRVSLV